MAQQINLHSPVLSAPQRAFSARTMGLSLLALMIALGALGTWMLAGGAALRADMLAGARVQAVEREQLAQAIAARSGAGVTGSAALAQERVQLERNLEARRALAEELARGRIVEGHSHAAVLRMISLTVPEAVWLDQIRVAQGSLELAGMTLQPQALRPWLLRLAEHPLTQAQRLGTVKLERVAPSASGAPEPELWAFVLSSQVPRSSMAPADASTGAKLAAASDVTSTQGVTR